MIPDIKIRTFIGPGIRTYIPGIAKVRQEVLHELPYLPIGDLDADLKYLKHLSLSQDAIAVVVFDGSTVIGASTGMPLAEESPAIQEPFIKQHWPIEEYYYFGLSALLKAYRSRGIAHHFFDLREGHVRHLKRFSKVCFISILPQNEADRPTEQMNLELFWKKRGYVEHPEVIMQPPQSNKTFPVTLKVWAKEIQPAQAPILADLKELQSLAYD